MNPEQTVLALATVIADLRVQVSRLQTQNNELRQAAEQQQSPKAEVAVTPQKGSSTKSRRRPK